MLRQKVDDNEISEETFNGSLTSKTEPLLPSGCDCSNSEISILIGDAETPSFARKLDSEETLFATLDNMMQSDDNSASNQSPILIEAPTDTIDCTDLWAMISTHKTRSETERHSELPISSPTNAGKSFADDEGPKLEFAANPLLESKTSTENSPTKISLDAESMRVLCSELLIFKRSYISNHTGFESELGLIITRLESTMKLAEALNKEIERMVSEDMPETESELKVQNVKLKYYIASSSRAFGRISLHMTEFRAGMQRYIQETGQFNDGMNELLPRLITALCSKN